MAAVEFDVGATMRDGTVLRADVHRPEHGGGPWPVLLVRSPYDKRDPGILALLDPELAVRRGYLVVIQDVRGRFRSAGDWQPLVHEQDDGRDTVRWAARLPGADGRVVMYGPSYLGQAQWAALSADTSELIAAAPEFTWSDPCDGLLARGGADELGLITQWTLGLGRDLLRRRHAGRPDESRRRLAELADALGRLDTADGWDPLVLRRLDLPVPAAPPIRPVPDSLGRLTAPTLTVAGWYDAFLQGSLDNHVAARASGRPAALIVGPWSHNNQGRRIGGTDFGPTADAASMDRGSSLRTRQLDWFDRQLGRPTPSAAPPVLLFVMGADEWRELESWPPPAVPTPFHLRAGGVLSAAPPEADEPADGYRHDPADPVPTRGGQILLTDAFPAGPLDQRPIEDRSDVLVYTGPVLADPLELIGRVRVHLGAGSTTSTADWVARLCDVGPDGVSVNITDGVLRAHHADAGPRELAVDLWSTAYVLLPGHRLRLQIASSCFPRWDPTPEAADRTVHHSAAHPSHVVLPVVRAVNRLPSHP